MTRDDLRDATLRFLAALNRGDLDALMHFFAVDATYETFDGDRHQGVRAIRAALAAPLRGDLGDMQYHLEDLAVDEAAGVVTVRYLCRHTLPPSPLQDTERPGATQLKRLIYRGLFGTDFGWHGIDVLHLHAGLVKARRTYAQARLPLSIKQPPIPPQAPAPPPAETPAKS